MSLTGVKMLGLEVDLRSVDFSVGVYLTPAALMIIRLCHFFLSSPQTLFFYDILERRVLAVILVGGFGESSLKSGVALSWPSGTELNARALAGYAVDVCLSSRRPFSLLPPPSLKKRVGSREKKWKWKGKGRGREGSCTVVVGT